jgi:hypothetical protein
MQPTEIISFTRYLEAKKSVDDRSINCRVWESLAERLKQKTTVNPIRVIEAGAGIGTMLERMLETKLLLDAHYTGFDIDPENITHAHARLPAWAGEHGFKTEQMQEAFLLKKPPQKVMVEFELADILSDAVYKQSRAACDLLIANAFLDLTDIPSALPCLLGLLKSNGLFYFSINFDGLTILEPPIEPEFDRLVLELYHRTMDERLTNGLPSGDSQAGRHLFTYIRQAGGQILAAGASDWVVFPGVDGYPTQEADFLHFIIQTIDNALRDHAMLDRADFEKWIHTRHAQIERSELVYIAHQIDILGQY